MIPERAILKKGTKVHDKDNNLFTVTEVSWLSWDLGDDVRDDNTHGVVFYECGSTRRVMVLPDFLKVHTLAVDKEIVDKLDAFAAYVKGYIPPVPCEYFSDPVLDGYGYHINVGRYRITYNPRKAEEDEEPWCVGLLHHTALASGATLHDALVKCVKVRLATCRDMQASIARSIADYQIDMEHATKHKKLGTKGPF